MQQNPASSGPILNYAGPRVPSRPAFNLRRALGWKGDHLFRVYVLPEKLCCVRIGGSRSSQAAVGAQFGLVGALVIYFLRKNAMKKETERVFQNEHRPIGELMAGHKLNHEIPIASISDVAIEPPRMLTSNTRLTFNLAGEKKRMTALFDKADDVTDAIRLLTPVFPAMRIMVQFNEKKQRYVKTA
jgi:hypothetical protein